MALLKNSKPMLDRLYSQLNNGDLSRREFVRLSCLIGIGATAAYKLAGIPIAEAKSGDPFANDPKAKSGGILKFGMEIQKMDDPALFSWTQMSNQARHILEYLTITDNDGITHPMLAESWSASNDLKTWTIKLRKNVMWHNGDTFNADDVIFNFNRWIDPKLGSALSNQPTMNAMLQKKGDKNVPIKNAVEKIDDYTVRLNLSKPVLSVPEDLYSYQCCIVHRDFKGLIYKNPNGTGPFTLKELKVGEICKLRKVKKTADGKIFKHWAGEIYLDGIDYIHFENENQLLALLTGDINATFSLPFDQLPLAKSNKVILQSKETAITGVMRFRTSLKPFDNKDFRLAIQHSLDTSEYQRIIFGGVGIVGEHHHVSPIHPAYVPIKKQKQNIPLAKKLLAKSGYEKGFKLSLSVGNTSGPWEQTMAEIFKRQLKAINIDVSIDLMTSSKFWEVWDKVPFGLTVWTHRPLETMVLSLAYRSGAIWNESEFADPKFDALLDKAQAEISIPKRKKYIAQLEKILQSSGVIIQSLWKPVLSAQDKNLKNYSLHPSQFHNFYKVWLAS